MFGELTLECLELHCWNLLKGSVLYYERYVDDCILIPKTDHIDHCSDTFDNYNYNLKFTYEIEIDCKISYLEVELIREIGSIISKWYRKPTYSGRFINFNSHHTIQQKRAIIYCLVEKAIKLSHPRFHADNIKLVKTLLKENGYPIKFINIHISNILHHVSDNNNTLVCDESQTSNCDNDNQRKKLIVLPYIKNLRHKLRSILKRHRFRMIHEPYDFNCFVKLGKDTIDTIDACGVVYNIDRKKCDRHMLDQREDNCVSV